MNLRNIFNLIVIALLVTGCSAANKVRRAERLLREAEAMGLNWHNVTKTDTVYRDTVLVVKAIEVDTLVKYSTDTITVVKNNVVTRVKINPGKTVYIDTKCPEQKIVYRERTAINTHTKKSLKAGLTTWQIIGIALFCFLLGFMANDLYRKFSKR